MTIYAIEEECSDAYYGWFVSQLFVSRDDAAAEMLRLAAINRGINYRVTDWPVVEISHEVNHD